MRVVFSFAVILIGGVIARADDKPETRHWTIEGISRFALIHVSANVKTL